MSRFGIETPLQLAITVCVLTLVVVTTLGGSGGAAWVFLVYRSLLPAIAILCVIGVRRADQRVCPQFLGCIAVLIALMLASVLRIEGSHFEGFYLWYKHAFFLCAFVALANFARYQSARWKGLILGSIVLAAIVHAIPDLVMRRPLDGFSQNNYNYFATFLLIALAASLAVAVFGAQSKWRLAAALAAAFLMFAVINTSSRGGALGAALIVLVAAIRAGSRIPRQVWILAGIAGLVTVFLANPFLIAKFLDRGASDPYNYARVQVWLNTLPVIAEYPVLGTGFGQFDGLSRRFTSPMEGQVARYLKRARMAHSEYLQHIAELGIPAALLMFSMFGYMLFLAIKRAPKVWPEYRCFQEAAILTAAGVGAHALVDNSWTIPVMASGLVMFSLADVLPLKKKTGAAEWNGKRLVLAGALGAVVYAHAVLVPGIALYLNDAGHAAFDKSDLESAERLHAASLRFVPDHPLFLDNLGMVYLQKSVDAGHAALVESARDYFTRAIAASPRNLDAHVHMETALIRSLNSNPEHDREIYSNLAENNARLLAIDPYIPVPRSNLAAALYYLGQRDRAMQEIRQAIEYEPNYVPGYLQLANWHLQMGNEAEAARLRTTGFEIVNKYRDYRPTDPYIGLLLARPLKPQ